ncbi:MAG: hypothetical protein ACK4NF_04735, partial [Planctomycetota bacterium]
IERATKDELIDNPQTRFRLWESLVRLIEPYVKIYFRAMNNIYINMILPVVADMCYVRCMCGFLGIKCDERKKTLTDNDIVQMLLYFSGVFMQSIEEVSLYATIEDKSLQAYPCVKNIQESFKKLKEELSGIVGNFERNLRPGYDEREKISEVKNKIEENKFREAFDEMMNNLPAFLVSVVESGYFTRTAVTLKAWEQEIIEGISNKDKCFLDILYELANKEIEDEKRKEYREKMKYLNYLVFKNVDAELTKLISATYGIPASDFRRMGTTVSNILSYIYVLPYRIYAYLSLYKKKKCYDKKDDGGLRREREALEIYRCIFDSPTMTVACHLEKDTLLGVIRDWVVRILKVVDAESLKTIQTGLNTMVNKRIDDYKSVEEINNLISRCEGINILVKLKEALWNNVDATSNALVNACIPQKECGDKKCIDVIETICNDPVADFPVQFSAICKSWSGVQCCACNAVERDAFDNTKIGTVVYSYLTTTSSPCRDALKLYKQACGVLEKEIGPNISINEIKKLLSKGAFCGTIREKLEEGVIGKYLKMIEDSVGRGYVEILENYISAEKLKELYSKYSTGNICND